MTEHVIESNIVTLNERFNLPHIDELVKAKSEGAEKMEAINQDIDFHKSELERLLVKLEQESERSSLPERPAGRDELNDLLMRLRMKS